MKKFLSGIVLLVLSVLPALAQEDLLKMAIENTKSPDNKVSATFKTTKLINAQTNETVHKRTLDFRVGHRFGNVGKESFGGVHTLYGLDAAADIRIAFEYGITDQLTAGISRSKRQENIEGLVKYRILQQSTGSDMPLSVTVFANAAISPVSNTEIISYRQTADRLSYTAQLILSRKITDRISVMLLPTMSHRNFVFYLYDTHDLFALGAGGRFRFTKSSSVLIDYFYNFDEARKPDNVFGYFNPLGAGFEIETGGHVFTIMFTNASGIIENDFIPYTTDSWTKGGFKFSFNISRNFRL